MKCDHFEVNGGAVFICSRGTRKRCSVPGCDGRSARQCDYPVKRRAQKSKTPEQATLPGVSVHLIDGTCDAHLCARHATNIGPERDLCPAHAKLPR